jgi:hypothetical protein
MTKPNLIKKLKSAKHPEDVFSSATDAKEEFREYAKQLHPDRHPGDKAAEEGFKLLNDYWELAEKKIAAGTYGDKTAIVKPIKLATKKAVYTITSVLAQGDICQIYDATSDVAIGASASTPSVVVKVVRSPANNDLLANEATRLNFMKNDSPMKAKPVMKHVPQIVDSFVLNQGAANKQVVVLRKLEDYTSPWPT